MALYQEIHPEYVQQHFLLSAIIPFVNWSMDLGNCGLEERSQQATELANNSTRARICLSFNEACAILPLMILGSMMGKTRNGLVFISLSSFLIMHLQKKWDMYNL